MAAWSYTKGLHDLGNGNWAYLLPDGSWGWSNSGYISDSGQNLMVDTLFDLPLTAEMLATLRDAIPGAARIEAVVNTHNNGDHTFGNQLVEGARIIATEAVADGMAHENPQHMAQMLAEFADKSEGGKLMAELFGHFDFTGINLPPATDTFAGSLEMKVGDKAVHLVDVGPAHTSSDVLVHVPGDKLVYTGDIMFNAGHAVIWAGPVSNWIRACELILSWGAETIVPGHGPIASRADVAEYRDYLAFLHAEAKARFDAGMPFQEAAFDIGWGRFAHYGDPERTVINLHAIYGELAGGTRPKVQPGEIWNLMARYIKERRARHDCPGCTNPLHSH